MSSRTPHERGSAVVDFALIAALVTLVFVGVVQLAVVVHVRNTLVDCAGEGARLAALAGSSLPAGRERARALIAADLTAAYADDVTAEEHVEGALTVVVVRVRAPLPLLGLFGVGRTLTVEGHAVSEAAG